MRSSTMMMALAGSVAAAPLSQVANSTAPAAVPAVSAPKGGLPAAPIPGLPTGSLGSLAGLPDLTKLLSGGLPKLPGLSKRSADAQLPTLPALPALPALSGGSSSGSSGTKLPVVGSLAAGGIDLPVLGRVPLKAKARRAPKAQLKLPVGGDLPIVGSLLGGSSSGTKIPIVSSLLDGSGLDLPVLGRVPILQNGKKAKRALTEAGLGLSKREAFAEAGLGASHIEKRQAALPLGGDLPVLGSLLGGGSSGTKIPVVSSLLDGNGLDLPVLGRVPVLQNGKKN